MLWKTPMNALMILPSTVGQLPTLPVADLDRARGFAMQDKAASTRAAYGSDFRGFEAFCLSRGVSSLPALPETVAGYLAHEAERGMAASTVTRRCAAIRYIHKIAELEPPTNSE